MADLSVVFQGEAWRENLPIQQGMGMRIRVTLEVSGDVRIPANHQDALAAVVYGLLERSSMEYSQFLHDQGYTADGERRAVKLFCFGWLRAKGCRVEGANLRLRSGPVEWTIGSPIEAFLRHSAIGLMSSGTIRLHNVQFRVTHVQALAAPDFSTGMLECSCLSPIVASVHRAVEEGRHPRYVRPTEGEEFSRAVHGNLAYKYRVIHGIEPGGEPVQIRFNQEYLERRRGGTKLITTHGIQVVGAYAPFTATGDPKLLEIGYDCGFGEKNSTGFGMVEVSG